MKPAFVFIFGAWLLAGCASHNVNPPAARTDTGYVDFYTTGEDDLNWDVSRFSAGSQKYAVLFSEFKPLSQGVLRLALSPGKYQLRVTFLNCVVRAPAVFEVEAVAGMVTPVHVIITEDGVTQVQSKEPNARRHVRGGDGPMGQSNPDETSMYRLSAVVNQPVSFRVKEKMPYAH